MAKRLADGISAFESVAVVGLAKNVGKTVTLNYIIQEAANRNLNIGVTSIGVDGEGVDIVTSTKKPEIKIHGNMLFATSETHYRSRRIESEILEIGGRRSSLGRIVTARAFSDGKVLLSGPSETNGLKKLIGKMNAMGAGTVLVDGAISRLSPASPAVTDAMILATGAAVSPDIRRIVSKTAFVCSLIKLPEVSEELRVVLSDIESGVHAIDSEGEVHNLGVNSVLELEKLKDSPLRFGKRLFVAGMVGDRFMKFLAAQKACHTIELIARDFTRFFVEPDTFRLFRSKGGKISVLKSSKLMGVTINPWSPQGYVVDKEKLLDEMTERLDVPVFNIYQE